MIRTAWAVFVAGVATFYFGSLAIVASLLRVRGPQYSRWTSGWASAILRASGVRVHLHGEQNARWDSGQVLVSNHVSAFDILALASAMPTTFYFVAKRELESIPFFGAAWKAAGHVSIDRSNRQKAHASLREAGAKIRAEHGTVIIFAEGTRSRTGELLPFKKGAFQLAIEAGVPVLPTVLIGSFGIMRPGSIRVRPQPVHIHFLPPIDPTGYTAETVDALVARTHEVMRAAIAGEPPRRRVGQAEA